MPNSVAPPTVTGRLSDAGGTSCPVRWASKLPGRPIGECHAFGNIGTEAGSLYAPPFLRFAGIAFAAGDLTSFSPEEPRRATSTSIATSSSSIGRQRAGLRPRARHPVSRKRSRRRRAEHAIVP